MEYSFYGCETWTMGKMERRELESDPNLSFGVTVEH